MIDEVLNSYRLTLEYLCRLIADVSESDFTCQPHGVVNHPAWVIGHLTCSCQSLAGELALEPWLPATWEGLFGTGSLPTPTPMAYPSKIDLLTALADGVVRISDRIAILGEQGMSIPLPDERFRATFPTVGHAVTHILTGHAAVHVGQVSVWRRAAGYPPLSEAFA